MNPRHRLMGLMDFDDLRHRRCDREVPLEGTSSLGNLTCWFGQGGSKWSLFRHHSRPVSGEFQPDRFVSAERIQELEDRITRLIYDLNRVSDTSCRRKQSFLMFGSDECFVWPQEREDRMALETQVRQLTFSRHRGHEN